MMKAYLGVQTYIIKAHEGFKQMARAGGSLIPAPSIRSLYLANTPIPSFLRFSARGRIPFVNNDRLSVFLFF